jgi:hypothetical protein
LTEHAATRSLASSVSPSYEWLMYRPYPERLYNASLLLTRIRWSPPS